MNSSDIIDAGETSVAKRAMLLAAAVGTGAVAGIAWNPDVTNWAYYGFLQHFLDPQAPIASLGIGVALGFLVGFVHVTAI